MWIPRIVSRIATRKLSFEENPLQQILNWAVYQGDGNDVEITCKNPDEKAVSLDACAEIGKSFRYTLKGPNDVVITKYL